MGPFACALSTSATKRLDTPARTRASTKRKRSGKTLHLDFVLFVSAFENWAHFKQHVLGLKNGGLGSPGGAPHLVYIY